MTNALPSQYEPKIDLLAYALYSKYFKVQMYFNIGILFKYNSFYGFKKSSKTGGDQKGEKRHYMRHHTGLYYPM
jgi:hypothetical protein